MDETLAGCVPQHNAAPARREFEHRAIFANDDVKARQVAGDGVEIRQTSSGNEDDNNAAPSDFADGLPHGRIECSVHGDGAVVVECQGGEFHDSRPLERSSPVFRYWRQLWRDVRIICATVELSACAIAGTFQRALTRLKADLTPTERRRIPKVDRANQDVEVHM